MGWLIKESATAAAAVPVPFVVGMSRSGTTLLRMMLDAHPDLAIPPETRFIPKAVSAWQSSPNPTEAFVQALVTSPWWSHQHVDSEALRQRLQGLQADQVSEAVRTFYRLYAERFAKPRWGDKSPYLRQMTFIHQLLPEARFVHIVRDGRDVFLSLKDLWWGPKTLPDTARWWKDGLAQARAQVEQLPWYMEVCYETLVSQPEQTLRRICSFLDLAWNPAMLAYHQRAEERLQELTTYQSPLAGKEISAEQLRGIFTNLTKPPQTSRIGRWQMELTPADVASFDRIAADTLREFGYPVTVVSAEQPQAASSGTWWSRLRQQWSKWTGHLRRAG